MRREWFSLGVVIVSLMATCGGANAVLAEEAEALPQPVNAVAFSPDGKTFASAHVDGVTRLWDAATGALRHEWPGHKMSVADVAYSPDGQRVASLSWHHSYKGAKREINFDAHVIHIWNSATGKLQQSVPLEVHQGIRPTGRFNNGGLTVAFLPNKTDLVTTGHSEGLYWLEDVWVWNLSAERLPKVLSPPLAPGRFVRREGGAVTLAVSPNSQFLGTAGTYFRAAKPGMNPLKEVLTNREFIFAFATTIRLWNLKEGKIEKEQSLKVRCRYEPYDGNSRPIKPQSGIPLFAPNGRQLFVVLHSGEVAILEIPSLKEVRRIKIGKEPERHVALTAALLPNNRVLVAHGTTLHLVHLENSQVKLLSLQGLTSPVTALAVSPLANPQCVAVGCLDGTLGTWDLDTQQRLLEAVQ